MLASELVLDSVILPLKELGLALSSWGLDHIGLRVYCLFY